MIPVEAVEAAARTLYQSDGLNLWEKEDESTRAYYLRRSTSALEAAAPHIRAQALDDAKDALNPGGSYVLQNIAKWLSERAATERTTL